MASVMLRLIARPKHLQAVAKLSVMHWMSSWECVARHSHQQKEVPVRGPPSLLSLL